MAAEGLASLSATALLFFDGIALVVAVQTGCGLLVPLASLLLREPPRARKRPDQYRRKWINMRSVLLSFVASVGLLCGACWVLCVFGLR